MLVLLMGSLPRRTVLPGLLAVLVLGNPLAASARASDALTGYGPLASTVGPAHPVAPAASPSACQDKAYRLLGGKWKSTLDWWFQSSSTPGDLSRSAVLVVLKRSFDNITGARNDCGLLDTVSATSAYKGTTGLAPSVTKRGRCAARDGYNVIGFGQLPAGVLAVTCVRSNGAGRLTEADIRINSNVDWALSVASCSYFEELIEPTMTHEIGHAYGLGHVGEARHGRLTMSPYSDGPCSNGESTLGWGDIRGLHHLYPL